MASTSSTKKNFPLSEHESDCKTLEEWMQDEALEFYAGPLDANHEQHTPTNEVDPRMVVTDFYGGGMLACAPDGYNPLLTGKFRKEPKGQKIQIENIFEKNGDKTPPRYVTLVGPAGSGKTTLLQRFARNFIRLRRNGEIMIILHGKNYVACGTHSERETAEKNLESCHPADHDSNKAVVENIDLAKFLFVEISGESARIWIQWMKQNPKKIIFLIDSLDTLPFKLIEQRHTGDHTDKASPAAFLYSILIGKLFSGARILSSAREYAITEYEGDLRADRIVALVGLSEESREEHINFVLGPDDTATFISDLKLKYPGLWALCATPVFLNYTLIDKLKEEDKLSIMPSTMTGVIVNLLQNLLRSKHAATSLNPSEIIDRLKKLSYQGIKSKKVTFEVRDLEEAELTHAMAATLSISVPGRNYRILKGENLMFFSHQSIEELLSALYVLQMEMDGFTAFLDTELNKPENSIVRRFVSGLLLHEEVHDRAIEGDLLRGKGTAFDEKRVKLIQVITDQVKKRGLSKPDRMELYITLHEASEGSKSCVHNNLKSIDLAGNPMRPSDMHAIATTVKHCKVLRRFDISDCDVTSENLDALLYWLNGARVEIKEFAIRNSLKLETEGFKKLGAITKECQVRILELDGCNITPGEMQVFSESLDAFRIDRLTLKEYNSNIRVTDDMLIAIKGLLPKVTGTLDLDGWIFSDEDAKIIRSELQKMKKRNAASKLCVVSGDDGSVQIEGADMPGQYTIDENAIGKGDYAEVYRARNTKSGDIFAVKKILNMDDSIYSELNVLTKLEHPRLVLFFGFKYEVSSRELLIFMELMRGGSLAEYLGTKPQMSESRSRKLTKQILEGLVYLHETASILHGDIHSGNILLVEDCDNVKIGDFGLSKLFTPKKEGNEADDLRRKSSWAYFPKGHPDDRWYDLWRFGLVVIHMVTEDPILCLTEFRKSFMDMEVTDEFITSENNPREKYLPDSASVELQNFLSELFVTKTCVRATSKLQKSEWITGNG